MSVPLHPVCAEVCGEVCRYGYEAELIGRSEYIHDHFIAALDSENFGRPLCYTLRDILVEDVNVWLKANLDEESLQGLILCCIVRKLNDLRCSTFYQRKALGLL